MQNYTIETDENRREIIEHGDTWFPLAGYDEQFSKFVLNEVPWHWHEEIELVIVLEGSTLVEFMGENSILKPGEGIFINRNVLHKMTQIGNIDCRIINFVLKAEFIGGSFDSKIYRAYILPICSNRSLFFLKFTPTIAWQKKVLDEIHQAFAAYSAKEFGYEMVIRSKLTRFWLLMCRHQKNIFTHHLRPTVDEQRIKKILHYIHSNYTHKITIKLLAKSADISESECYRLFKRKLHCTPLEYILKLRLQVSTQKLIDSDISILNLAIELGFASSSYFSKKFKSQYSITPRSFRLKNQKKI